MDKLEIIKYVNQLEFNNTYIIDRNEFLEYHEKKYIIIAELDDSGEKCFRKKMLSHTYYEERNTENGILKSHTKTEKTTEDVFIPFLFQNNMKYMPIIEDKQELKNLSWDFNSTPDIIDSYARQFLILNPLYYDDNKIWWKWNKINYCWEIIDETNIFATIRNISNYSGLSKSQARAIMLNALKDFSRNNKPKELNKNHIQFKNKIYDIKTNDVFEATSEFFGCNPIPFNVGDSSETSYIDKLFNDWVGTEYSKTLYEILAFCCLSDYPINRLFIFNGSGSNGKSKYIELINRFIGSNNCCSSDLDVLTQSRFESSKLFKKLVCCMGETNFNVLKDTNRIKRLTGGDPISAEFKGKNSFDFLNFSKIIIGTNCVPQCSDKTKGWYRRTLLIDFPNEFEEGPNPIDLITNEEYENLARKCLEILPNILLKCSFSNEGSIEDRQRKYEEKSNPILSFINENYEKDINGVISCSETYILFSKYCDKKGLRKQSYKEFITSLNYNDIETERKNCYKTQDGFCFSKEDASFKTGLEYPIQIKHTFIVGFNQKVT